MIAPLHVEPLALGHLEELAGVLLRPEVYAYIEDSLPPLDEFMLGLKRALDGPKLGSGQLWFNYLMRDARTGTMLGRLEATVHDEVAEVAVLLAPAHWGKGYASQGLKWLQNQVRETCAVQSFWATTVPKNERCQALLRHNGYVLADPPWPTLFSHDAGDLVFERKSAG